MLILLSVCMLSQPGNCHEDRIEMSYEPMSPITCLRNSQSALDTWQAAHPEWHAAKWRCAARANLPKDL